MPYFDPAGAMGQIASASNQQLMSLMQNPVAGVPLALVMTELARRNQMVQSGGNSKGLAAQTPLSPMRNPMSYARGGIVGFAGGGATGSTSIYVPDPPPPEAMPAYNQSVTAAPKDPTLPDTGQSIESLAPDYSPPVSNPDDPTFNDWLASALGGMPGYHPQPHKVAPPTGKAWGPDSPITQDWNALKQGVGSLWGRLTQASVPPGYPQPSNQPTPTQSGAAQAGPPSPVQSAQAAQPPQPSTMPPPLLRPDQAPQGHQSPVGRGNGFPSLTPDQYALSAAAKAAQAPTKSAAAPMPAAQAADPYHTNFDLHNFMINTGLALAASKNPRFGGALGEAAQQGFQEENARRMGMMGIQHETGMKALDLQMKQAELQKDVLLEQMKDMAPGDQQKLFYALGNGDPAKGAGIFFTRLQMRSSPAQIVAQQMNELVKAGAVSGPDDPNWQRYSDMFMAQAEQGMPGGGGYTPPAAPTFTYDPKAGALTPNN